MVPKGGLDRTSLGDHAIGFMRRGFGLTRSARSGYSDAKSLRMVP
jgi:hypothetical protein